MSTVAVRGDPYTLYAHAFLDDGAEVVIRELTEGALAQRTYVMVPHLARHLGAPVEAVREVMQALRKHQLVIARALTARARDEMAWRVNADFPAHLRALIERAMALNEEVSVEQWVCVCEWRREPRDYFTCRRDSREHRLPNVLFVCECCGRELRSTMSHQPRPDARRRDNELARALLATL